MEQTLCSVTSNAEVAPGVHLMRIEAPHIAAGAQPGQFITVRCEDLTLRRPFSIHQSSPSTGEASGEGEIAILFRVAGKGTFWLSQRREGEKIDILGPLGKGFAIGPRSRNLLLVAGGIGIAPLVFLMQQASSRHRITLIHGASTAAQLYPDSSQLAAASHHKLRYIPVTEDGSMGRKGMATDILSDFLDWADRICACGPVGMYKTMAETPLRTKTNNLKLKRCQVSLEVRMGCGFGACYGCTINTKKGLKHVCRDGPVFELDDIIWQEVRI
jgi:dihydroorotate dehydrogenase electron transfer subunit